MTIQAAGLRALATLKWQLRDVISTLRKHSICSKGERQSPIDIGRQERESELKVLADSFAGSTKIQKILEKKSPASTVSEGFFMLVLSGFGEAPFALPGPA